ncbi:hypothetical protein ACOTF1_09430 [Achromobacter ruhlandii]|uniref:hypothetical protein n=1 Tax=Achromobacter ruhlandii TaxID=72557 RepID=UPI003B9965EC
MTAPAHRRSNASFPGVDIAPDGQDPATLDIRNAMTSPHPLEMRQSLRIGAFANQYCNPLAFSPYISLFIRQKHNL